MFRPVPSELRLIIGDRAAVRTARLHDHVDAALLDDDAHALAFLKLETIEMLLLASQLALDGDAWLERGWQTLEGRGRGLADPQAESGDEHRRADGHIS